jgi:hypothetical protein
MLLPDKIDTKLRKQKKACKLCKGKAVFKIRTIVNNFDYNSRDQHELLIVERKVQYCEGELPPDKNKDRLNKVTNGFNSRIWRNFFDKMLTIEEWGRIEPEV